MSDKTTILARCDNPHRKPYELARDIAIVAFPMLMADEIRDVAANIAEWARKRSVVVVYMADGILCGVDAAGEKHVFRSRRKAA